MRSSHIGKFFVESLKKKPKIKYFYDNLKEYSLEDIKTLPIPLWYRERLTELKKQNYVYSEKNERILSGKDLPIIIIKNPNPIGKIYSSNDNWFLRMNKSEQEVTHGSLIFVSTNYMLVDGRFKNNLIDLNKIIENL